jgi:hypothetical protein
VVTLNLTPHATATHWSTLLVGLPWQPNFACWDLVRVVQLEQFGRVMPAYDLADERAPEQLRSVVQASGWQRLEHYRSQEGDVLLMRGPDGLHIGIVVWVDARCQLLHNLGGMVRGVAQGSVRIDPVADLGRLGYGRFELWRAAT